MTTFITFFIFIYGAFYLIKLHGKQIQKIHFTLSEEYLLKI